MQHDRYGVDTLSVLLDNGIYKMWNLGLDSDEFGGYERISYATYPNGINWTKNGAPVLQGEGLQANLTG